MRKRGGRLLTKAKCCLLTPKLHEQVTPVRSRGILLEVVIVSCTSVPLVINSRQEYTRGPDAQGPRETQGEAALECTADPRQRRVKQSGGQACWFWEYCRPAARWWEGGGAGSQSGNSASGQQVPARAVHVTCRSNLTFITSAASSVSGNSDLS